MSRFAIVQFLALVVAGFGLVASSISYADEAPPRLVVIISIDQLRGDLPLRMRDRLEAGGFRRFFDNGVVYTNAHFQHATTYTACGHASLVTGGNGREHGIIGNSWFDPATGKGVYCTDDDRHPLIDDPDRSGGSPRNLLSTTIGDELVTASNGVAKVFSVAQKDRSAILMGGRMGKSFWYNSRTGAYVTSTYYYDQYPDWAARWNAAKPAQKYRDRVWDLSRDRSDYVYADDDDREVEIGNRLVGKTFPYDMSSVPESFFGTALGASPYGDELTLNFVKTVIEHEQLGQDAQTDLLCVGFSATDLIGHTFGPYSLEQEDNLFRLDRTLADFFAYLDEHVGLDETLVVLSADHGVDGNPPQPEAESALGGQIDPTELREIVEAALQDRYGNDAEFLTGLYGAYIYLNKDTLRAKGIAVEDAERVAAEAALSYPGIAEALTRTSMLAGDVGPSPVLERVARSFHARRSGNVFIVQEPYYRAYSGNPPYTATHGTPYPYDTHVPVYWVGGPLTPDRIQNESAPESIAPTIAHVLGIEAPSGSTAPVMTRVADSYVAAR